MAGSKNDIAQLKCQVDLFHSRVAIRDEDFVGSASDDNIYLDLDYSG